MEKEKRIQTIKIDRTPDTIRDFDTVVSLFGPSDEDHPDRFKKIKENPVYKKFREWTRKIQFIGYNNNVPIGELLLLISIVFHYAWDTIPYGRYPEIYEFVKKNYDYRYKWIYPEMYEYLLSTGYYNVSSTFVDKKATWSFCKNIELMMENNCSNEEFLALGRTVL